MREKVMVTELNTDAQHKNQVLMDMKKKKKEEEEGAINKKE